MSNDYYKKINSVFSKKPKKKKKEDSQKIQLAGVEMIKIKGDPGKTPTKEELISLIRPLIPKVKDGHTPSVYELARIIRPLLKEEMNERIPSFNELKQVIKSMIPKPLPGPPGPPGEPGKGKPGEPGKNGSPDTPKQIAEKLNTLTSEVDFKILKNVPQRMFGGKVRSGGGIQGIIAGTNVTIDNTDPRFPVVSSTGGGGGGGAVDSVNGQTGTVVLGATDVGALSSGDNVSELTNDAGYLDSVDIADINATGTPSSSTYLRGDGSWQTPSGSGAVDSVNGQTGTVVLDKSDVGLSNVDNTSDLNKPISTATQTALNGKLNGVGSVSSTGLRIEDGVSGGGDARIRRIVNTSDVEASLDVDGAITFNVVGKQDTLVSGTNIKTINSTSILGSGNIVLSGAPVDSVNGQTGVVVLGKSDVGLSNVDNTSDANKPVSTAQQTALDGKANTAHTHPTTDLTATGGTSTSFLRKDNTWATPTNTTYTEITEAEIDAGTATTLRTMTGRRAGFMLGKTVQLTGNQSIAGNKTFTGTTAGITSTMVGLGNVDNTSDATKNSATATLTNKRITQRVTSVASSATPTINTDNTDIHRITALATNITSMTTNLSGTPTHGQNLIIEITGTAARTIAWGASFEDSTIVLPTTTVTTAMLTVGFKYNSATSKWRCLATV